MQLSEKPLCVAVRHTRDKVGEKAKGTIFSRSTVNSFLDITLFIAHGRTVSS
jgi:hypothetical protein